jgi:hypothetical protein
LEENNHGEGDAEDPVDSNDEEEAVELWANFNTFKFLTIIAA